MTELTRLPQESLRPIDHDLMMTRPESVAQQQNPLHAIHMRLRGRYPWVVLLSLLLGAGGAFGGLKLWKPVYRSSGQIEVQSYVPDIFPDPNSERPLPGEQYIASQIALIQSPRVIGKAQQWKDWRELNRGADPQSVEAFKNSIAIERDRNTFIIQVGFEDSDPTAALIGATAVIETYMKVFPDYDRQQVEAKLDELGTLKDEFEAERSVARGKKHEIEQRRKTNTVEALYEHRRNERDTADSRKRQLEFELARLKVLLEEPATLAVAEVLHQDEYIRARREQLAALQNEIVTRYPLVKLEMLDDHPGTKPIRKAIRRLEADIAVYVEERYQESMAAIIQNMRREVESKEAELERITTELAELETEVDGLGKDLVKVSEYQTIIEDAARNLKIVEERIQGIEINDDWRTKNRVRVVSDPEKPLTPFNQKKKLQYVAGLGGLGAAAGCGLIFLVGLLDRRYRYIDDAEMRIGHLRMLGVLPRLPDDLSDPESAAIAAHAVSQIRSLLQIGPRGEEGQAFAVSSALPGEGKTSLAISLAMSFAAAGSRTLLIDFDLSGRALSSRLGASNEQRLGRALIRAGVCTAAQMRQALFHANRTDRPIEQAIIDLGLATQSDIERAIAAQGKAKDGLAAALAGENFDHCTVETELSLLSVLPIAEHAHHLGHLSPSSVERLIHAARQQFDAVLIDCGPVPASVEASMVAATVDGVVFTVARGTQAKPVDRALAHLQGINAHIAGIVLNRVIPHDVEMWASSSQLSRRVTGTDDDGVGLGDDTAMWQDDRFGPVAGAVSRLVPLRDRDGDEAGADVAESNQATAVHAKRVATKVVAVSGIGVIECPACGKSNAAQQRQERESKKVCRGCGHTIVVPRRNEQETVIACCPDCGQKQTAHRFADAPAAKTCTSCGRDFVIRPKSER